MNKILHDKYISFISNTYVEQSQRIKWCPDPHCDKAIKKSTNSMNFTRVLLIFNVAGMVMCTCGNLWCWECNAEGHWPTTCEQSKWNKEHNRNRFVPL